MDKNINIQRKIALPILISVTIVLVVFALFTVNYIRTLTKEKVESEALSLVRLKAEEIVGFFKERARVPVTFFQNPFFLEWFSNYNTFRTPLEGDRDYARIFEHFNVILKNDSTIKSVFFATDNTQEYFDHEGRYEEEGYLVKNRDWWREAIAEGRLYCGLPEFDYADSSISTSMHLPVYNKDGRFLGIGGADILITTIGNIVRQIRYKNYGDAFLIDGAGNIIYFPRLSQEASVNKHMSFIDTVFAHASGFQELSNNILKKDEGLTHVMWEGEGHIALYAPVQASVPHLNWSLGLIVPKELIVGPVRRITIICCIIVLLAIIGIFLLTLFITSSIIQPLNALASRLDQIANQKSDLTNELPVETNDAIGQTAKNFNTFIAQMRELLHRIKANAKDVVESTAQIYNHEKNISEEATQMSSQVEQVAATSQQMMNIVEQIADGARHVADLSKKSNDSATKGKSLIHSRIERMQVITDKILRLYGEMKVLNDKSEGFSSAVQVIDEISEQISLLAVNASIEASKAGEAGRGFSVVASEIKNLSQRTFQENKRTISLLNDFRNDIQEFHQSLLHIKDRMSEEIHSAEEIIGTFRSIYDDVSKTDGAIERMKNQTEQQSEAIRTVDESIQQISDATKHIAEGVSESFHEITQVDSRVKELQKSTDEFKVE